MSTTTLRRTILRPALPFTSSLPSVLQSQSQQYRSYATASTPTAAMTAAKQAQLQAKQLRLAEKAGRMKQNVGVISVVPIFANYVRPRSTRSMPAGLKFRDRLAYWRADYGNDVYTLYLRYKLRSAIGPKWFEQFTARAEEAYIAANKSLMSGTYTQLEPLSTPELIADIKALRLASLQGVRLSWKLHSKVDQDIMCIRQQEIAKLGEFVGQIAVRFMSMQSLEVRNVEGKLIKGDHSKPVQVTEYYVLQRDLWKPREEWLMVKKVGEIDPYGKDRELFQ